VIEDGVIEDGVIEDGAWTRGLLRGGRGVGGLLLRGSWQRPSEISIRAGTRGLSNRRAMSSRLFVDAKFLPACFAADRSAGRIVTNGRREGLSRSRPLGDSRTAAAFHRAERSVLALRVPPCMSNWGRRSRAVTCDSPILPQSRRFPKVTLAEFFQRPEFFGKRVEGGGGSG
jgi:hypothetical protein